MPTQGRMARGALFALSEHVCMVISMRLTYGLSIVKISFRSELYSFNHSRAEDC